MAEEALDSTKRPEDSGAEKKSSFDSLLKAWALEYAADLATLILGETPQEVLQAETCLATAAQRLSDKVLDLRFLDRPGTLLHIEFQTESSPEMPERQAVYLAMLQPLLREPQHEGKTIDSAVVYLDEKRFHGDPGVLDRTGTWGSRLLASYRVVKLWEISPDVIRRSKRPGLLALLPLTGGNPEQLLVESRDRIQGFKGLSKETKDLLVLLAFGLAGLRVKSETIKRLLKELCPMGTETIFEILEERGRIDQSWKVILRVLTRRFGALSPKISPMIQRIDKLDLLDSLIDEALVAPTLEDFLRRIPPAEA